MKLKILISILMLLPNISYCQKLELQIGIGKPIFSNDIRDSNNDLWSSDKHTILSVNAIMPINNFDLIVWHHSTIEDVNDAGISGVSIFFKSSFTLW